MSPIASPAQRYPDDFDGIIAGHPVHEMSALGEVFEPWRAKLNTDAQGKPILTDAKVPALHRGYQKQWDEWDERVAEIGYTGRNPDITNGVWTVPDGRTFYLGEDIAAYLAAARQRLASGEP